MAIQSINYTTLYHLGDDTQTFEGFTTIRSPFLSYAYPNTLEFVANTLVQRNMIGWNKFNYRFLQIEGDFHMPENGMVEDIEADGITRVSAEFWPVEILYEQINVQEIEYTLDGRNIVVLGKIGRDYQFILLDNYGRRISASGRFKRLPKFVVGTDKIAFYFSKSSNIIIVNLAFEVIREIDMGEFEFQSVDFLVNDKLYFFKEDKVYVLDIHTYTTQPIKRSIAILASLKHLPEDVRREIYSQSASFTVKTLPFVVQNNKGKNRSKNWYLRKYDSGNFILSGEDGIYVLRASDLSLVTSFDTEALFGHPYVNWTANGGYVVIGDITREDQPGELKVWNYLANSYITVPLESPLFIADRIGISFDGSRLEIRQEGQGEIIIADQNTVQMEEESYSIRDAGDFFMYSPTSPQRIEIVRGDDRDKILAINFYNQPREEGIILEFDIEEFF